jgi:hypothetical protein
MKAIEIVSREIEARATKNGSKIVKANHTELLKFCIELGELNSKGNTEMVCITANTALDMRKNATDGSAQINPFWKKDIRKITSLTGVIGFDYQNAVNGRRAKEGVEANFEAEAPKWGELVAKAVKAHVVDGEMKLYIPICCKDVISQYYTDEDGNIIDKELLQPFLPIKKEDGARQEIENVLVYRTYTITNILFFSAQKKVLNIVG